MNFATYEQADESAEVKLNLCSLSLPVHIYVSWCISLEVVLALISDCIICSKESLKPVGLRCSLQSYMKNWFICSCCSVLVLLSRSETERRVRSDMESDFKCLIFSFLN